MCFADAGVAVVRCWEKRDQAATGVDDGAREDGVGALGEAGDADEIGRIVLCDFDSTCLGPPGVDLAAVATAEIWFRQSGERTRLAKSYGHDITTDPAWPIPRQACELTFVVGGAPPHGLSAQQRHERPLDSLRRIRRNRSIKRPRQAVMKLWTQLFSWASRLLRRSSEETGVSV